MAYYFFLGEDMLPVPPPKMTIKIGSKNKTVSLINEGEINLIKTPGLTEVSFNALLPNQYYPFASYDTSMSSSVFTSLFGTSYSFKKADYFLHAFETAKRSSLPLRLIITRMSPRAELLSDTNLLVTLEDYSISEDAKEGFDVIAALKFKQYRPYATKELEVTKNADGTMTAAVKTARPAERVVPNAYRITREQSIWEACKKASGGTLDWRAVASANRVSMPFDAVKGMVLNIG